MHPLMTIALGLIRTDISAAQHALQTSWRASTARKPRRRAGRWARWPTAPSREPQHGLHCLRSHRLPEYAAAAIDGHSSARLQRKQVPCPTLPLLSALLLLLTAILSKDHSS